MAIGIKVQSKLVTNLIGVIVDMPNPYNLVILINDHRIAGHIDWWVEVSD